MIADDSGGGSSVGGAVAGVVLGLLAVGLICYCVYKRRNGGGGAILCRLPDDREPK